MPVTFPRYQMPRRILFGLLRDWVFLRPRSFHEDARACIQTLGPQLQIEGAEHIPAEGPRVVTFNHYCRPGFGVWWLAMAVSATLPPQQHMTMTGELTRWYPPFGGPLSRFALPRLARVYGFTPMPPMPPRPQDVEARARAVRRVLEYIEKTEKPLVVIAPEGRDNLNGGVLDWPPQGAGRFLALVAARGLSLVPVGGWDEAGALRLRFGASYRLQVPKSLSPDEKDRFAAQTVMQAIAALLPERLRGEFGLNRDVIASERSAASDPCTARKGR